jgi:hypothetical protein
MLSKHQDCVQSPTSEKKRKERKEEGKAITEKKTHNKKNRRWANRNITI